MAIPSVTQIRGPLLQILGDGRPRSLQEASDDLAAHFRLSPDDRQRTLNSGYSVVRNRTTWAGFHLRKAGLVEDGRRGVLQITEAGRAFLKKGPVAITSAVLMTFPAYREWEAAVDKASEETDLAQNDSSEELAPEEAIAHGYAKLRATLSAELIERIKAKAPEFFEKLVLDLLLAMGYGGSRAEAASVTKASGDGGIDGVINEDRLGLDAVYVQAKRWENTVGVGVVREFVGSLVAHRANKGVFITTSDFALGAREYVQQVTQKVVLINGQKLAELMIDYGVGVSTRETFVLKRADEDYFAEN